MDVYFKEDIAQMLTAVNAASGLTAAIIAENMPSPETTGVDPAIALRLYRQGYREAVTVIAAMFGIEMVSPIPSQVYS